MCRGLSVSLVIILLFCLATIGYYLLEIGPKKQQRERIQPLVSSGLSLDGSIRFDELFSDQSFRWAWQENKPYHALSTRSNSQYQTPVENVLSMFVTVREYGCYS